MNTLTFKQLPGAVQFSTGISFFLLWYLFEQHVINKWLYPYLPGYRVGDPCVWDLGVALLITMWILKQRKA